MTSNQCKEILGNYFGDEHDLSCWKRVAKFKIKDTIVREFNNINDDGILGYIIVTDSTDSEVLYMHDFYKDGTIPSPGGFVDYSRFVSINELNSK